jgi:hypothetical protein
MTWSWLSLAANYVVPARGHSSLWQLMLDASCVRPQLVLYFLFSVVRSSFVIDVRAKNKMTHFFVRAARFLLAANKSRRATRWRGVIPSPKGIHLF